MRKTQKNSLLYKLIRSIFLLLFLPLLLIIWMLGAIMSNFMLSWSETLFLTSVNQAAHNIEAEISIIEQLSHSYALDTRLKDYLRYTFNQSQDIEIQLESHTYMQNMLDFPKAGYLPISRIMLFAENDTIWISGGYLFPIKWLKDYPSINTESWWSMPKTPLLHDDKLLGLVFPDLAQTIFFSRSLPDMPPEKRAVLTFQTQPGTFTNYLSALSGNSHIISRQGDVLGSVLNMPDDSIGLDAIINRLEAEESRFFISDNRLYNLITVTGLSNGWLIVNELPYDQLLGETRMARWIAIGIALISGILCFAFLLAVQRTIISRMRLLLEKIDLIRHGDFEKAADFENCETEREDELMTLSNHLSGMSAQLKQLIHENYALSLAKKDSELRALQAQINPHFLYNTLSTIKWMTYSCTGESIRAIVDSMAAFYRISLSNGREIIPISDELQCTRSYLAIQAFRTMDQIQVHFDVDEELMELMIPKLILQPIVENSIIHGPIERQPMTIVIRIKHDAENLLIEVIDDGMGMPPENAERLLENQNESRGRGGYGLYNVKQRLMLFYGDDVELVITSALNDGTDIRVKIPYKSCELHTPSS